MTQTLLLQHQPHPMDQLTNELVPSLAYVEHPDCEDWVDTDGLVGMGYFSSVWTIPGEPFKVLKVSHTKEDACREYMRWAFKNPHPNAPKIHSINYQDHMMVVVMDRYYSCNVEFTEEVPGREVLVHGHPPDPDLSHEVLCSEIRNMFPHSYFDLHPGNVMRDRDGTIIITDPVSSHKAGESE